MNTKEYLEVIEEVIHNGKYKDTWESLCDHPVPVWYQNAKFGIFIHWGVYSVPAFYNEWYPREMYQQGSEAYEHHRKTYGPQKDFGYKDFIPMFQAEKFDPAAWAELFQKAGAKYVMPVAEHHDGFQMYKSELSHFNAAEMGPCRDVVGELKKEIEKRGMVFTASSHRAEHFWFFDGGLHFDSDVADEKNKYLYGGDYGNTHQGPKNIEDIYDTPPTQEFLENWLARTCELIDQYQPKVVWFDWWIQNLGFKPYLRKLAAYYYNRALEWGEEVTVNYKFDAFMLGSAVYDIERGQLSGINTRLWQNDTAVAKNSWGYTENNDFKNPVDLVCDLVDIVSKNGCLLLNVGPKSDGTITEQDQNVLLSIGRWLEKNGEGIYNTTYWRVFGEGPTEIPQGSFKDVDRQPFTSSDIRFTYNKGTLYAFVMKFPNDGIVRIRELREMAARGDFYLGDIKNISVLGYDNAVTFERMEDYLKISVAGAIDTEYPVAFKISLD